MWLATAYEATSLFSLKPATATASGGKTLLIPTPFAIKMALLDAACRLDGVAAAEAAWPWLCELVVAMRPPEEVVVNNTFIKVLKPRRNPAEPGSQDEGYFQRTITYREYAHLEGVLEIALELTQATDPAALTRWLMHINYLGKRGGFMQMVEIPSEIDQLPMEFLILDGHLADETDLSALLTQLDDVNPGTSFEQVSIYTSKQFRLGKDRILHNVTLPYERVASSRGYTHYRRSD